MNLKMRVMKAKDHKILASPSPKSINEMTDLFKNAFGYILLYLLKYVPGAQEAHDKGVRREQRSLEFVTDRFKTQKNV